MERLPALLFALVVVIVTLILGSIFSESIMGWLRLRLNGSRGGEDALLWGLLVLAAFSFGLLVMYLLLRP